MTDLILPCFRPAVPRAARAEEVGLQLDVRCCEPIFDNIAYGPPC